MIDDTLTRDMTLQLEALKLLQEWSIWLIALATGFLGVGGWTIAQNGLSGSEIPKTLKRCICSLVLSIIFAVFLVGAIPAQVQHITCTFEECAVFPWGWPGTTARGIYVSLYLGYIPIWVLVFGQRLFFLGALICGAHFLYQQLKGTK